MALLHESPFNSWRLRRGSVVYEPEDPSRDSERKTPTYGLVNPLI